MLIFDLVDPRELQGYVRGLAIEAERNRFQLSQYLPQQQIQDTEFRVTRGNLLDVNAAMYRAFDAEAPIGKRQGGTRVMGSIPPLSQKLKLGEEERLRLRAVETGDNAQLVRQVFDDAAATTRALLARLELARGEALVNGSLVLAENGLAATIDYGRSASHSVAAPVAWSDTANSDPLTDLTNWVQTYVDTNGTEPGFAIVSQAVVANLLKNTKIRNLVASAAGTPSIVRTSDLNNELAAFGLPPLVQYNTKVRVNGVSTRVIPNDKLILMPPADEPLGAVFSGITAEALELVDSGYLVTEEAPGITTVIMKEFDPVARWTKSSALALPVLANPDLVLVADVQ